MPKKFHWDLIRLLAVAGGILGIILAILMFLRIWGPLFWIITPEIIGFIIQIIICSLIILGWAIIGLDIWESRYAFLIFLVGGLVLIILFGNLAGILLVVAAIPIPFDS